MNPAEAKSAAQSAGCTLVDQNITLTELNQLLLNDNPSCEDQIYGRLFADFALGSKLGAVLAIGTAKNLRQLHNKLNEACNVI